MDEETADGSFDRGRREDIVVLRNDILVDFDRNVIAIVLIGGFGAVMAFMTATVRVVIAKTELRRACDKKRGDGNRHGVDSGAYGTSYCFCDVHHSGLYHMLPASVYNTQAKTFCRKDLHLTWSLWYHPCIGAVLRR